MSRKPYDRTFRNQNRLCFVAELPAFATIGRHFAEIQQAYHDYQYAPDYIRAWQDFVAALKVAAKSAIAGKKDWNRAEGALKERFADKWRVVEASVMPIFAQGKETPHGLSEYLQHLAVIAERCLQQRMEPGRLLPPLDASALGSAAFQQKVEALRGANPEAFERMQAKMREYESFRETANDPEARQRLLQEQLGKLGQSPLLQKMLEQMQGASPEVARRVDAMRRLVENPRASRAEMEAIVAASFEKDADEPHRDACEQSALPQGSYCFYCGRRKKPTAWQTKLFDRLAADQIELARQVGDALRAIYREMVEHGEEDPRELVLTPRDFAGDVPLQRFKIDSFLLDAQENQIGIQFESVFPHHEEHGCGVLIKGGGVTDYGDGDVLEALEAEHQAE